MVVVLDRAGVIEEIHIGAGLEGLVEAHDLIGQDLHTVFEPDDATARLAQLAKVFEQGANSVEYESTLTGTTRFLEARGIQLDENRALIVIRNVTDERTAYAHLRAIYDAFPDIISISNRNGVIVEMTVGRAEQDLEIDPASYIGKSFVDFFPPEEAVHQLELQQRALAGEIVTTEYKMAYGAVQGWAESSGTRLDDDHVLWVTRDITRRRRAEEELRASEDRYRNIVETAAEG